VRGEFLDFLNNKDTGMRVISFQWETIVLEPRTYFEIWGNEDTQVKKYENHNTFNCHTQNGSNMYISLLIQFIIPHAFV